MARADGWWVVLLEDSVGTICGEDSVCASDDLEMPDSGEVNYRSTDLPSAPSKVEAYFVSTDSSVWSSGLLAVDIVTSYVSCSEDFRLLRLFDETSVASLLT